MYPALKCPEIPEKEKLEMEEFIRQLWGPTQVEFRDQAVGAEGAEAIHE